MSSEVFRIGFDLSGVVVNTHPFGPDSRPPYHFCPPMEHALEAIRSAVDVYGVDSVFIITRASWPGRKGEIRRWLRRWFFFEATGLKPENLIFCQKRQSKGRICRLMRISCFVDNHYEALNGINKQVQLFAFRPKEHERQLFPHLHDRVTVVQSWLEFCRHLRLKPVLPPPPGVRRKKRRKSKKS